MSTYQTPIYLEQGAAQQVITSGGSILIQDDGTLYFGTGSAGVGDVSLKWNGTVLLITGLPTSDPTVAGALYTATNVVKVSAG